MHFFQMSLTESAFSVIDNALSQDDARMELHKPVKVVHEEYCSAIYK